MSMKKGIATLLAFVMILCLTACSGEDKAGFGWWQGKTDVWAKRKLDVEMNYEEVIFSNICNGKLCYADNGVANQVVQVDPITQETQVTNLVWPEEYNIGQVSDKYFVQIAVGGDGSIYGVVLLFYKDYFRYSVPHLCKFTPEGALVYATEIETQFQAVEENGWSSAFGLEVDSAGRVYLAHTYKMFLFDENGNYDKCIDMNPLMDWTSTTIQDLAPGRDGNVYLYYNDAGGHLVRVDYESGTLVDTQDVKYGELVCFDATDGFYVGTDETLYHYETDLPTAGRYVEELFDWWDLLIYKENVRLIGALREDCILVVDSSSLEESRGVYIIERMTRREAKREGYTYVEIP